MCKDNQVFKLCTCAPLTATVHNKNSRRAKRERADALPIKDTTWHLQRFIQNIESGMEGLPMMPVYKLNDDLTSNYVVSQLNAQNCFDFDYVPNQGDNLTLRSDGDFMSFIYGARGWEIRSYDPFRDRLQGFAQGKMNCEDK